MKRAALWFTCAAVVLAGCTFDFEPYRRVDAAGGMGTGGMGTGATGMGGAGAAGGSGGDPSAGGGGSACDQCNAWERCEAGGCTMGTWYFITTSFDNSPGVLQRTRSVRGDIAFDGLTEFSSSWVDTGGGSGTSQGTLVVHDDGTVDAVESNMALTGQIDRRGMIIILGGYDAAKDMVLLSVLVRISHGHALSELTGAAWRLVGNLGYGTGAGEPSTGWMRGFNATLNLGSATELSGTGVLTPSLALTFGPHPTEVISVSEDGAVRLPNQQNGSFNAAFEGQMSEDGNFVVLHRAVPAFSPGTMVMFKKPPSGQANDPWIEGEYSLLHLTYDGMGSEHARLVSGSVELDGAGAVEDNGQTVSVLNGPGPFTVLGNVYDVGDAGARFEIRDSSGFTGNVAGAPAIPASGDATSSVLGSYTSATYDMNANPNASLILWIRRF